MKEINEPVVTTKCQTTDMEGNIKEVCQISVGDIKLNCVFDYSIKKSFENTEVLIRVDFSELQEVWDK